MKIPTLLPVVDVAVPSLPKKAKPNQRQPAAAAAVAAVVAAAPDIDSGRNS